MTDKRSATEILLSIESDLKTLSGRVSNIEMLQKLMASKGASVPQLPTHTATVETTAPQPNSTATVVTSSSKPTVPATPGGVINKENFDSRPKTSTFAAMAAAQGVDIDGDAKRIEEKIIAKPADPSKFEDMTEAPVRSKGRGQRGKQSVGSKVSVSQTLRRDDGGPLFLASIEIMDQESILINQTRTDTKGRWLMVLAPGDYQVNVNKRFPPDSGRESINTTYEINVPPSDTPLELNPLELSG